jgi:hypothetical protein
MGVLLNFIPGANQLKSFAGGVTIGTVSASITTYILCKKSQTKKILEEQKKLIEKENQKLIKEIKSINIEKQALAITRISILKQLAWADGNFLDQEKLFIIDYIINCSNLRDDMKVQAIKELDEKPINFMDFMDYFCRKFKNIQFCQTTEEYYGFRNLLLRLSYVDKELSKDEQKYINYILACANIDNGNIEEWDNGN